MAKRDHQVTVPLDQAQREFIEARARIEGRTVAAIVRRCVEAVQRAQAGIDRDRGGLAA